ncbi:S-layer homology domain-containing protein [Evtepia sp.]|uniref:S-layer homology domain-containing protein n=1 Tax=Evtepia sp. TaxID=2773933 RepID=UPI003990643C
MGTQWETRGKNRQQGLGTKGFPQKKVLSLVLCVAMLLSVMVMGTGAAFTDEDDFSPQYAEAAEVLAGMKVMQGYDDGSFLPQRNITRAQVATMIYRAATSDVTDTQTPIYADYDKFDDVQSDDWFAGYVNYCGNAELIKGFTPTTFGPNKNVTGYQVLAMILRAVGYDANDEFTGSGWEIRTATTAESLGMLKNVQEATLGQAATRELVAELIFRAMLVPTVTYMPAVGYVPVKEADKTTLSLGEREFGLYLEDDTTDDWGRPSDTWHYKVDNKDKETVIEEAPLATFTVATTEKDLAAAMDETKTINDASVWTNGVEKSNVSISPTKTSNPYGAQGTLIEVYDNHQIVIIDTYLALVTDVDEDDDSSLLTVWYGEKKTLTNQGVKDESSYAEDTYVLVNFNEKTGEYSIVQAAESFVGTQTVIHWNDEKHTIDGEDYMDAVHFYLNQADKQDIQYSWFLDQYGNLIGSVELGTNYAVLKDLIWIQGRPGHAEATLVYMDGSEETVTVDQIDAVSLSTNEWVKNPQNIEPVMKDGFGFLFGQVATDSSRNTDYEGVALYKVDTRDNGLVKLEGVADNGSEYVGVANDKTLTTDKRQFRDGSKFTVTTDTQILVRSGEADNYTYTTYTIETLPEYVEGTVDLYYTYYINNGNNIVDRVYVKNATPVSAGGTHLFVPSDSYRYDTVDGEYLMDVIVDGAERTIYSKDENVVKKLAANTEKLFNATFDNDGYVTAVGLVNEAKDTPPSEGNDDVCDYLSDNITVTGNTITTSNGNYALNSNTVYIGCADAAELADAVKDGAGVWVVYDTTNGIKYATAVYVGKALSDSTSVTVTATSYDGKTNLPVSYDEKTDTYTVTYDAGAKFTVTADNANTVILTAGGSKANLGTCSVEQPVNTQHELTIWPENGVESDVTTITVKVVHENSAIGQLSSVSLSGESWGQAQGYGDLNDAIAHAKEVNLPAASGPYTLNVSSQCWGAVAAFTDKDAVDADRLLANNQINAGTLSSTSNTADDGIGNGSYIVIKLVNGNEDSPNTWDVAYYAYHIVEK